MGGGGVHNKVGRVGQADYAQFKYLIWYLTCMLFVF